MSAKAKAILVFAAAAALTIAGFIYRDTLSTMLTAFSVSVVVLAILYILLRIWLWKRRRRRRRRKRRR